MPEPIPATLRFLVRLPVRMLDALLWLYQKIVSPALQVAAPSCGCRFAPTCSHYAREALRTHGLLAGLALTLRRLAKCGPWHPGGLDPVPAATRPAQKISCRRVNAAPGADRSLLTAHRTLS